jgi:AhpD family alkylhydroperoxidase
MKNPTAVLPDALHAMRALGKSAHGGGLPPVTIMLVHLRASQINGCTFCVDMHARELREAGESDERIFAVAAWRDAPFYSDQERAALEMTEAVTRIADKGDPVPDELWERVSAQFDENQMAALLLAIATINVWNRLNVPTRQPPGIPHG